MENKKLFLIIGGTVLENDEKLLKLYYKNNVSVSNQEYENKLIYGFEKNHFDYIFLSAPSIGFFPFNSKKAFAKDFSSSSNFISLKYCLVYFLNHISKTIAIKKAIKKILKEVNKEREIHIIACECHSPYLQGIRFAKRKHENTFSTLLVPDLPKNMGKTKNFIRKMAKRIDLIVIKCLIKKYVDSFVAFTKDIDAEINTLGKPSFISEGLVFPNDCTDCHHADSKIRCNYTGKLDEQNGVELIAETAKLLCNENIVFDIYGTGPLLNHLIDESEKTNNLVVHGYIDYRNAQHELSKSSILLSPRFSDREYTKFSFPSKILDYLSSKKPIVTFDLPCYTQDMRKVFYFPNGVEAEHLASKIMDVINNGLKIDLPNYELILKRYDPLVFVRQIDHLSN